MAPSAASNLDIWAWQQNAGIRLRRWEYSAVMAIGTCWLRIRIADAERQRKR